MSTSPQLIEEFNALSLNNKEQILIWLKKNFLDNKVLQDLVVYLEQDQIVLKQKFHHMNKFEVEFYFLTYNKHTRSRNSKHIGILLNTHDTNILETTPLLKES